MKHLLLVQNQLLLHLACDLYQITVVKGNRPVFRIRSEERISYFEHVPELRKQFMEKNQIVAYHFVMVVDVKLNWSIYCIKDSQEQEPVEIFKGQFVSEKMELKKLVGLHFLDGKLLLIFDQCNFFYLPLPKALLDRKPTQQQGVKFIMNKQFIPYGEEPKYEHQQWAVTNGFLPQQQQYDLTLTHYSQLSENIGMLLVAIRSKSNGLSSIYSMEYDRKKVQIVSSRNVALNLKGEIMGIYSTKQKGTYLIQTTDNLIVWIIQLEGREANIDVHQDTFVSNLTQVNGSDEFLGITPENKAILLAIESSALKRTNISFPPELQTHQLLQLFINKKTQQQFALTKKEQLFFSSQKEAPKKIINNEHTQINSSQLIMMPSNNFLVINKQRGVVEEKVIFGHHHFAFDANHYAHGLMLNSAQCLNHKSSHLSGHAIISSPLIGLIKLNMSFKQKGVEISKQKSSKSINKQESLSFELSHEKLSKSTTVQTLFMNEQFQITAEQVIGSSQKSTRIQKLFDGAIDFISYATVLSNELVLLAISEQIHVFDTKLKRKYIYCFNSEIKSLYNLNDINVIGVELFQSESSSEANELNVLILDRDKAIKLKTIEILDYNFKYFQLQTVINTSEYKLNIFGNKIVICSNDSLHKYQLDKIVVEQYQLPLPISNLQHCDIIPTLSLTKDGNKTQFVVIFRQQQLDIGSTFDNVEIYTGSFSPKYLLKKVDFGQLNVTYERVLTLSELPHDYPLFAVSATSTETVKGAPAIRHLGILGEKHISLFSVKFGKIQMEWIQDKKYMVSELEKIESIPKDIVRSSSLLSIEQPLTIVPTSKNQYFLLYNSRELYYAHYQASKITTISYYSLINDDFSTFRNNLALTELNSPQFMATFSQKMRIKSLKYLSDQLIFVLYEYCIVVLEIGLNHSLVVRQELKFRGNQNTEVIRIEEFLQNWDDQSIYLRQGNGRIYLLMKGDQGYKIKFHSYMDEDVLLFGRLTNWYQRERTFHLRPKQKEKQYDELVLKKDGQLIVTSKNANHDPNKLIYL